MYIFACTDLVGTILGHYTNETVQMRLLLLLSEWTHFQTIQNVQMVTVYLIMYLVKFIIDIWGLI